jgi:signal peptidase II
MEQEKYENMPKIKFFNSGILWLWLTLVVLLLDRVTKKMALHYLSEYSALHLMPGFNLSLSYNKGAAFSFLDGANGWQMIFFGMIALVASVALLIWLTRISWKQYSECIPLSLIIGGALGNLWDRIQYGHVIDFIQWYVAHLYWPTFNIADSAICVGAVLLIWNAWREKKKT